MTHPLSESLWLNSLLEVRQRVSEQPRSGSFPVEGFRDHVATDGSLLRVTGKRSACGWSVVQLDHDKEMEPMHGMHGTLDAEL